MIVDLAKGVPDRLEAEFAVIGAGAAGLTLTRSLLERGRSVLLLESGGWDHEPASADLNRGETGGQPYYPLDESRLRFFGGTTAIWGGRCAELDRIDFERRDWVNWSGWPFAKTALEPWYRAARDLFELPHDDPRLATPLLARMDEQELCVRQWLIDTRFDRFGPEAQADLLGHPRLTLALHATVCELLVTEDGRTVTGLDVRAPGGAQVTATALHVVLAAGGLENPRLLLASNSVVPAGLGNGHDLVGRFFMEHPHGRGGRLLAPASWELIDSFRKRPAGAQELAALVAPAPSLQRERGILNTALTLAVRPPPDGRQPLLTAAYAAAKHKVEPTSTGRAIWRRYKQLGKRLRHGTGPLYWWMRERLGLAELVLVLRAEQAPNPDSRITLLPERDATGSQRIRLDWRMSRQDVDSAAELVAAFRRTSERLGLGTVEPAPWLGDPDGGWVSDRLVSVHPLGGYHHMGTTRMADAADRGVTDGWGQVHGTTNLHVAGSSLFTTSGWANPTLTIVALALRQAERLASR